MKTKQFLKILVLSAIALFTSSGKCGGNYGYEEFDKLLERTNLIYIIPKEYGMREIIENKQVKYHLAYVVDDNTEIRYTIIPYDSMLMDYNDYLYRKANNIKKIDSIHGELLNEFHVDANNLHESFFLTYLYNISEKTDSSFNFAKKTILKWEEQHVNHDFNADYGLNTWCKLDPGFGQKYKYCNIYMIHKKNYGAVFCYLLFKKFPDESYLNKEFYRNYYYNVQFYRAKPPLPEHPKGIMRYFKY